MPSGFAGQFTIGTNSLTLHVDAVPEPSRAVLGGLGLPPTTQSVLFDQGLIDQNSPRNTQRALGVSWITISQSPGSCGASFFQSQAAMYSMVGFSKPSISLR